MDDFRKNTRFSDFGKVECKRICYFPGTLRDISSSGMKVIFNSEIDLSMNDEYEIIVQLSKFNGEPMHLLVLPMWRFDNNSGDANDVQVGFSILPALDFNKFAEYVAEMEKNEPNLSVQSAAASDDFLHEQFNLDDFNFQENTECQFL